MVNENYSERARTNPEYRVLLSREINTAATRRSVTFRLADARVRVARASGTRRSMVLT